MHASCSVALPMSAGDGSCTASSTWYPSPCRLLMCWVLPRQRSRPSPMIPTRVHSACRIAAVQTSYIKRGGGIALAKLVWLW
eukprot:27149-Eustigmatos_ZCMA.PRE.1